VKIHDVINKSNLHQSAFCIETFDADIQIPEPSLQALSPFLLLCAPTPKRACWQATFLFAGGCNIVSCLRIGNYKMIKKCLNALNNFLMDILFVLVICFFFFSLPTYNNLQLSLLHNHQQREMLLLKKKKEKQNNNKKSCSSAVESRAGNS